MGKINRDDMLELTRRMTISRNCFHRIAGAYFDDEGYVDGTFNIHFQKLSSAEQESKLKVAKEIPFSETNVELVECRFLPESEKQGSVRRFLDAVLNDEMKNDAMMETFYEMFGERFQADGAYGLFFYLGNYDIPRKGTDKAEQWESEEVFRFLICAVCKMDADYEPLSVECGFLYPAYKDRGADPDFVDVYHGKQYPKLLEILSAG